MNELPEQDTEDLYSQYLQQQPVETQQEGDDLKEYLLEIEERLDKLENQFEKLENIVRKIASKLK
ncbi:hypothetical protein H6F46_12615 [Limnothrix sp. FACHB-1083]|uniref:hypothetical protein n=1 Tax=unclassified Limnothrix TaxID=2632864 RepID=UPI0016807369|nr:MULTISPECIES: hypothetical protein [unclassified Limnothrix]MBD2161533.1 hypothetical protein [Limnothrix sp. FACHB-1083]MBD2192247.1 hypothetical protein [Limnothrix sp. FACHB-1088]